MTKLEIRELEKADEKAWGEYIIKSNHCTFYHQIGWRNVVVKTYKHKPIYLIAKEEGEIQGVLPLFLMKSTFFGKKMVSVPFAPYGGVCADNKRRETALIVEAKRIAEESGVEYLELRNLTEIDESEFYTNYSYISFIINLNLGLDLIWKTLRRDKMKGVKKAKKANLSVEWDANIDNFYNVYLQTMKDLGTPVHDYNFFKNIRYIFPNETKILTVKYGEKVVCSKFFIFSHSKI